MELLLISLWLIITLVMGALSISSMIEAFKKEKYFRFGLECICAISMVCYLIKFIFI